MASIIHGVQQVSEISPNLYLTSIYGATKQNILRRNVTLLVNAAQELPKMDINNVESIKLFLDDTPYAMISVYFDRIADKIHEHLTNGGRVLVHCVLGVSRSTSLCLAYFMKYKNMTLKQAFEIISSKRPCVRPNPGFWRQLIDYEKRLATEKQQQALLINNNNNISKGTSIPITIVPSSASSKVSSNNNSNSTNKGYLFNSGSMPFLKTGSTSNNNNGWMSNNANESPRYKNSARQSIRNRVDLISNLSKSIQTSSSDTPGTATYQIPASSSYQSPQQQQQHRTTVLINPRPTVDYYNKPTFTTTYRTSYGTTRY